MYTYIIYRYLKETSITATTTIDTSLDNAKITGTENTINDDDDSSNEENVLPKGKRQYKHFNNDWTKQFAWLKNIKSDSKVGKAFCILCNKTFPVNIIERMSSLRGLSEETSLISL